MACTWTPRGAASLLAALSLLAFAPHAQGAGGGPGAVPTLSAEEGRGTPRGFPWVTGMWQGKAGAADISQGVPGVFRGGQGKSKGQQAAQEALARGEQGTPRGFPWMASLWRSDGAGGVEGVGVRAQGEEGGAPGLPGANPRVSAARKRVPAAVKQPVSETTGEGAPGKGVPGKGVPGKGVPGKGIPGKGIPGKDITEKGVPREGAQGEDQGRRRRLLGPEGEPEAWLGGGDVSLTSAQRMGMMLFLEQWFSFPGPQTCGNWSREYSRLHRSMRAGDTPGRFLTFAPDDGQGLGDRLLGMVSTFLAALVSKRAMIINDPVLNAAFEPGHVDWTPRDDVSMNATGDSLGAPGEAGPPPGAVLHLRFRNAQTRDNRMRVRFPRDLLEFAARLGEAHNALLETNGGILTSILSRPVGATYARLTALGMRLDTAYPCVLRFLLRPRPEVAALMQRTYHALHATGGPTVCIHMRVPDDYTWDPVTGKPRPTVRPRLWVRNGLRQLFSCASKVMESYAPGAAARWLFMSESMALRDIAVRTFPRQVVLSEVRPQHPGLKNQTFAQRAAAMRSTAADWLLFSTCKYYVIVDSGFCKTSLAFSTTAKGTFMFGRPSGWGFRGTCDPSAPATLSTLGQTWSGL